MKVALINLGDAPRVFYDRRSLPIVVGIGKVVTADMRDDTIEKLERHRDSETVLVADPGQVEIPDNIRRAVDILATIQFEEYMTLLVAFNKILPPSDSTQMRPTRIEMQIAIRRLIEDHIRAASRRTIHDDVDPSELEKEQGQQGGQQDQPGGQPGASPPPGGQDTPQPPAPRQQARPQRRR